MTQPSQQSQTTSIKPRLIDLIDGLTEEQSKKLFRKLQCIVPEDQRKHPRVACSIPVDYTTKTRSFEGFIHDISKGGVFIETRAHLEVGETIKITFTSPNKSTPVKISGRVVRKNTNGVGVSFESTPKAADASSWIDCRRKMAQTSEEKRIDPRVDLQCPVFIEGIREEQTITDLSIGGVFVECDQASKNKFRIGQLITLKMKLPTEDDMTEVRAQIVNYNARGMHCQFAHLGRRTENAIYRCFNVAKHTIPIK
jgi:uncharacterized protein (TIGR02266 family)